MKSQMQEVINRNALSSILVRQGYNVFLPVVDRGIDLIAHNEANNDTKLIQLKARWGIHRKYVGRNIWMAFPHNNDWYIVPHDEMLNWDELAAAQQTASWLKEKGEYHSAKPSKAILVRLLPYRQSSKL